MKQPGLYSYQLLKEILYLKLRSICVTGLSFPTSNADAEQLFSKQTPEASITIKV